MSNTVIQIKRSSVTATPSSLNTAEPAYSYLSDKLFLGNSDGSEVIEIGGRFYINVATQAYDTANTAEEIAIAAFAAANTGDAALIAQAYDTANAAYDQANVAPDIANSYTDSVATSVGTGANAYAAVVGVSANAYANSVTSATGVGANTYADSVAAATGVGANAYADTVGTSSNAYTDSATSATGVGANTYADSVAAATGVGANVYANTVGTSANAYADSVASATGVGANAYADTVGTSANAYADATFLSLDGGTVTGNLSVVGDLNVSGNTYYINVEDYKVDDPLIYLAGNNYTSDLVDIGFIGNYVSGGANLHTAFYREHEDGEYYLIVGYNQEPANNHIGPVGTAGSTLAYLNANLKAQSITVNSLDVETWITASFAAANAAPGIANSYADVVGVSANAYANSVASATGVGANTYADAVGVAANTYASDASNLTTGTVPTGRLSGSYTGITGVGTITTGTWNGSTISVPYGGTGATSFTTNGILYGQGTSALAVTAAGTEGQVLQADASGVPQFGDLDGGTF